MIGVMIIGNPISIIDSLSNRIARTIIMKPIKEISAFLRIIPVEFLITNK